MARKRTNSISKLINLPIVRLYSAIIWRYLVWLFTLHVIGALIFICLDLIAVRVILSNLLIFQVVADIFSYVVVHLLAFYLALESMMTVGFKSGHYKLVIENTRKSAKKK